jgi:hypothetical protein
MADCQTRKLRMRDQPRPAALRASCSIAGAWGEARQAASAKCDRVRSPHRPILRDPSSRDKPSNPARQCSALGYGAPMAVCVSLSGLVQNAHIRPSTARGVRKTTKA